jgi:hypothetical protein
MSNRKYPYVSSYFTRVAKDGDSCQKCRSPIHAGEQVVVAEVQVNWFRGDDEYEYFHARCDPRPPKPVVIHNPPDPARRTCPKCGKMFPVRRDMIQHLKAKHPKETHHVDPS